jgi:uncharacterized protein (DUF302 family)
MSDSPDYGYSHTLTKVGFDETVKRATDALQSEGFGVLRR